MLIRTTFSPLPPASRNVRTLRNDTLFSRKDTAGHVEIVCKTSCSRRRRRFLFSRSFTFSLLRYPFRPSTLVIYRGYAADARGEICTTRDRKKKKKEERTRAENSGSAILSFCLDHSISPPWLLCEQNRVEEAMR